VGGFVGWREGRRAGDEDGQLEFSGYKGNGKGKYRHNRRCLRSNSNFLLKSDAGKDTEGHLERRNDQRPREGYRRRSGRRSGGGGLTWGTGILYPCV